MGGLGVVVLLLESLRMGLWRSMTLPPPPPRRVVVEGEGDEETCSMLRHMEVAACDEQKMSTFFIFLSRLER